MAAIYNSKCDIREIISFHPDKAVNKTAGKLSGGWQRRLYIAQPKVVFLDEPTLGLDVIA